MNNIDHRSQENTKLRCQFIQEVDTGATANCSSPWYSVRSISLCIPVTNLGTVHRYRIHIQLHNKASRIPIWVLRAPPCGVPHTQWHACAYRVRTDCNRSMAEQVVDRMQVAVVVTRHGGPEVLESSIRSGDLVRLLQPMFIHKRTSWCLDRKCRKRCPRGLMRFEGMSRKMIICGVDRAPRMKKPRKI